jgi:transposase
MHQVRHEADSYRRVEVITGGRRRRDWSDEEKARIVAESADPQANISEVARRNGVSRGLLTVWRRQARGASPGASLFARLEVENPAVGAVDGATHCAASEARIEIEIAEARVFVPPGADAATVKNVIAALRSAR